MYKSNSKRVLSKIENLKINESGLSHRDRNRLLSDGTLNTLSKSKFSYKTNGFIGHKNNVSVDDYRTHIHPVMRKSRCVGNPLQINIKGRKSNLKSLPKNLSTDKGMYASAENPFGNGSFSITRKKCSNQNMTRDDSCENRDLSYETHNSLCSFSVKKLTKSRSSKKIRVGRKMRNHVKSYGISNFNTHNLRKCEQAIADLGLECFGMLPGKLVGELYFAKCLDLKLDPSENQLHRFLDFCRSSMKGRKIKLRDCGLGTNCCEIFADILKNYDISKLDLRKNIIGNEGIKELCKGISETTSLMHIDLGSNDITSDGANYFFSKIQDNQYLYSINMANVDGLHRNRLGSNGCKGLNKLLKYNKVLSMIDIADNNIGNEGIRNLLKDIDPLESNVVYMNLSNNNLSQG